MALYHKDLGFPKGFNSKVGTRFLTYSQHAKLSAINDRYGRIDLPVSVNTNTALCIEAEIANKAVTKLVYRVSYNNTLDLVLVVMPKGAQFIVKTVWLNLKSDKHTTLDLSKYEAA